MNPITDVFLPAALAFIMFSLGISLTLDDFRRVLKRPGAIAIGLLCQMTLLPALAFVIAGLWRLPAELAVGLVILAACPGGVTSGLITHLARGDTALSVSLTAVTSLAGALSVPLVVNLALMEFTGSTQSIELPVGQMVRGVFFLTTVPLVLGMLLRGLKPARAQVLELPTGRISTLLFVIIVIATFLSQRQALIAHLGSVGPAALALNLGIMALAYLAAQAARLDGRSRIAVSMECGMQNAALGIFVAATLLRSPAMMVPSVVYALLMNLTAIGVIVYRRRQAAAVAAS